MKDGFISFQVKGVDFSHLEGEYNPAFIGIYDGRGITEPIQYFNDYKHNFFRWNMHWHDRGAVKCVLLCSTVRQTGKC